MTTLFFDVSREQYELLLTVGDLQEVRRSVDQKRLAATDGGQPLGYEEFLDQIDLRMMKLAERCARLGLEAEFARITNGFPAPTSPGSNSGAHHMAAA